MRATRFAVVLFAILLVACGEEAGTVSGSDSASPAAEETSAAPSAPGPECVETDELTASENEWDPGCIVTSGSITITNDDEVPHNFTITGAVEEPLEAEAEVTVDVSGATEPEGDTYFLCTIHPGMDGFLWVQ